MQILFFFIINMFLHGFNCDMSDIEKEQYKNTCFFFQKKLN